MDSSPWINDMSSSSFNIHQPCISCAIMNHDICASSGIGGKPASPGGLAVADRPHPFGRSALALVDWPPRLSHVHTLVVSCIKL